jgi:hypothetical protein
MSAFRPDASGRNRPRLKENASEDKLFSYGLDPEQTLGRRRFAA